MDNWILKFTTFHQSVRSIKINRYFQPSLSTSNLPTPCLIGSHSNSYSIPFKSDPEPKIFNLFSICKVQHVPHTRCVFTNQLIKNLFGFKQKPEYIRLQMGIFFVVVSVGSNCLRTRKTILIQEESSRYLRPWDVESESDRLTCSMGATNPCKCVQPIAHPWKTLYFFASINQSVCAGFLSCPPNSVARSDAFINITAFSSTLYCRRSIWHPIPARPILHFPRTWSLSF